VRRIAITCVLPKEITEEFSREFDVLFLLRKPLTSPGELQSFANELAGCEALVVAPPFAVDRSLIDQLPSSLKVIATYSVGYDHLDLVAARAKGLSVLHTPDVLTDAVAEVALLLALGAARRVTESAQLVRSRHWSGWTPTQLIGQTLTDKVMGIFGYGRIGKAIAIRARAFGARIGFHDSRPKAATDGELAMLGIGRAGIPWILRRSRPSRAFESADQVFSGSSPSGVDEKLGPCGQHRPRRSGERRRSHPRTPRRTDFCRGPRRVQQ
jgi:lactate dehydrogenase-like 2-hydroxyacid dehydrogenase